MDESIANIVITDFDIKTRFNRTFINEQLKEWNERIEDMYDLHYPRMFIDPITGQLSYESNHIDSLAMDIIEEREKLKQRKRSLYHMLHLFDKTIAKYSVHEKKQIKQFQCSKDIYIPDIIDRLKLELYGLIYKQENQQLQKQ